jgi:hypothetical protein
LRFKALRVTIAAALRSNSNQAPQSSPPTHGINRDPFPINASRQPRAFGVTGRIESLTIRHFTPLNDQRSAAFPAESSVLTSAPSSAGSGRSLRGSGQVTKPHFLERLFGFGARIPRDLAACLTDRTGQR